MIISNDILFFNKGNKYLIYNYEVNKAVIVNEYTKNILEKFKGMKYTGKFEFLSNKEIDILYNNKIIYDDENDYIKSFFINKVINREAKVDIKQVYFHITQRCNLKCSYCYNKLNLNRHIELSKSQVFNVLDKLYRIKVKNVIFTGGEVLLRKDIKDILIYSRKLNFRCDVLTNGTLLLNNFDILEYVDNIIISLDTLNTSHNQRVGLDSHTIIRCINNIPKKYKNKISIRSVITKETGDDWKEIRSMCKKHNINHITVPFLPNDISEVKNMVGLDEIPIDSYLTGLTNYGANICGASYKIIAVNSNGDIYPCQCLIKKGFLITNITKDNWLEELSNSVITKEFMNMSALNVEKCKSCKLKYICGGNCRAISYNLFNSLYCNVENLCLIQKKIAEEKLCLLLGSYI